MIAFSPARVGDTNLTLSVQDDKEVIIEFKNGKFKTLRDKIEQLHIVNPFKFAGETIHLSRMTLKYSCIMTPLLKPGQSISRFPKNLTDELFGIAIVEFEKSLLERESRSKNARPANWKKHSVIVNMQDISYKCELAF